MLRSALPFSLLLLAACATAPYQGDAKSSGQVKHISVLVGQRELADNDAKDLNVDSQLALGVEFDSYGAESGSGFEVGVSQSSDDNSVPGGKIDVEFTEVYLGFRQTFMPERNLHPYVGGGATYIQGKFDAGPSDDDTDLAPYLHAGVLWDLGKRLRLGLDYRMVWAGFDIFGGSADGDYQQLALSLGFGF